MPRQLRKPQRARPSSYVESHVSASPGYPWALTNAFRVSSF